MYCVSVCVWGWGVYKDAGSIDPGDGREECVEEGGQWGKACAMLKQQLEGSGEEQEEGKKGIGVRGRGVSGPK